MRDCCVLGFDYGTKHIGVAVGQTVTGTASPLQTISTRNSKPDWAEIAVLIEEWQPDCLIVGEPLNMDGSPQAMTAAANEFARQLTERFQLPVHKADERLSTIEARRLLANRGQLARRDHPVAAKVILDGWLMENTIERT
ncbi:MAG: Holliday junction resolvase RuvX [Gammaproteobacteria bacterium]|nr:Holliday junction resolvase RuvX [Gammaproteobacteria bacterium]